MIILAPIQGYTEAEFRNAYAANFQGVGEAITPFVTLVEGRKIKLSHLRDVLPERNNSFPIVPQVIGNDINQFIVFAKYFAQLGYDEINWNLGCPMPMIANKKRGSGLLQFHDIIEKILEQVIPNIPIKLSIKTRLGYRANREIFSLIHLFNQFPIKRWIIHPRLGTQIYSGSIDYESLELLIDESKIPLIYNGDIIDVDSYEKIKSRFPIFHDFMIGRGILQNPFLPQILGGLNVPIGKDKNKVILSFYLDLIENLKEKGMPEKNTLNKCKEYWGYLSFIFDEKHEILKQIYPILKLDEFVKVSKDLILESNIKGL